MKGRKYQVYFRGIRKDLYLDAEDNLRFNFFKKESDFKTDAKFFRYLEQLGRDVTDTMGDERAILLRRGWSRIPERVYIRRGIAHLTSINFSAFELENNWDSILDSSINWNYFEIDDMFGKNEINPLSSFEFPMLTVQNEEFIRSLLLKC